jgi:hypothetical protein
MTTQIAKLKPGTKVRLLFKGSRSLGNEPYELDMTFKSVQGIGEDQTATFDEAGQEFTAYRFRGRWCYGTSAERLSLIA